MRCTNGHDMQFGAKFCHLCGMSGVVPTTTPPTPVPTSMGAPSYASYAPMVTTPASFDGFAIAGFVLGILGGSILAIVFSVVALSRIKKKATRGKGMAIAGLVLGILGTIAWVLLVLGTVLFAQRVHTVSYNDGWNAAKEWYDNNPGTLDCTTAHWANWIPYDDVNSEIIQGCRDWNHSSGEPDYRYPSNY